LVQDFLGFLMQLFCGDDANVPEVTPSKCPRKTKIVHGVMLSLRRRHRIPAAGKVVGEQPEWAGH
jgi:hypothetical protein